MYFLLSTIHFGLATSQGLNSAHVSHGCHMDSVLLEHKLHKGRSLCVFYIVVSSAPIPVYHIVDP